MTAEAKFIDKRADTKKPPEIPAATGCVFKNGIIFDS